MVEITYVEHSGKSPVVIVGPVFPQGRRHSQQCGGACGCARSCHVYISKRQACIQAASYLCNICLATRIQARSEEHTSELQSLMHISYAVFCLKKKKRIQTNTTKIRSRIKRGHKHTENIIKETQNHEKHTDMNKNHMHRRQTKTDIQIRMYDK